MGISMSMIVMENSVFQGKVEMELEVLTKEDAEAKPAGRARDEPNENPRLKPPECVHSNDY